MLGSSWILRHEPVYFQILIIHALENIKIQPQVVPQRGELLMNSTSSQ